MSHLFNQNTYNYEQQGGQNAENLQFYQSQYPEPAAGNYASNTRQNSFASNTLSPTPDFGYPGYNSAIPGGQMISQPISWLSAFGTGGLEGEPPLLEGNARQLYFILAKVIHDKRLISRHNIHSTHRTRYQLQPYQVQVIHSAEPSQARRSQHHGRH